MLTLNHVLKIATRHTNIVVANSGCMNVHIYIYIMTYTEFCSRVGWFANNFHEGCSQEQNILANHLTGDHKFLIHGKWMVLAFVNVKQSRCGRFETPCRSCDVAVMLMCIYLKITLYGQVKLFYREMSKSTENTTDWCFPSTPWLRMSFIRVSNSNLTIVCFPSDLSYIPQLSFGPFH